MQIFNQNAKINLNNIDPELNGKLTNKVSTSY